MHIHRQATPVVHHLDGAVEMQRDFDIAAEPGQDLVDTVVQNLLQQVVWPGGVRVHARASAHRLEPFQQLHGVRGIALGHRLARSFRSKLSS